jgi:hypothetical protein
LTYDKGSAAIHTLRFLFHNDTTFLLALRTYLQTYALKTATTANFQQVMEGVIGYPLDTFFQQWFYKEGYPIYTGKWDQKNDTVYVALNQQTSMPSSQTLFNTPLEMKFTSATGDTIVMVNNNANSQNFKFIWGRTMTGMNIDPNDWLIDSVLSITHDPTLAVSNVTLSHVVIIPNPTNDVWNLTGINEPVSIILTDVAGKIILEKKTEGNMTIPAQHLPYGIYFLQITTDTGNTTYKLIKE